MKLMTMNKIFVRLSFIVAGFLLFIPIIMLYSLGNIFEWVSTGRTERMDALMTRFIDFFERCV